MANNIFKLFETDPDARPKPRFTSDIVGRFRAGRLVGKMPESLNEWRVTTGDPEVAAELARLLGGEPEEWNTDREDNLEVLTTSKSVNIIIESSDKIDASMKLFSASGLFHHCDGVAYLSPEEDKGQACGCPESLQERKDKARVGRGPKPSIDITFRLTDAPDLGLFRFNSGSWEFVKVLHELIADVDAYDGPVRATLTIEHIEYTAKSGKDVAYNKPSVKVLGAYEAAGADDIPKAA
ncbi:hypothetical protein ADL27_38505 [Streptomyces sp. NRRL F-6602]|nr:hypothetical protein ADL27_38505 [Streptomyces sp. NRRL F-6602]